jgi:hypothetical protein
MPIRPCLAPAMEPCPARTVTILVWDSPTHQPAMNSTPWEELATALQASQITASPGSHSVPLEGSKHA